MNRGHAILAAAVLAAALWAYLVTHPAGGHVPAGAEGVPVWEVPLRDVSALSYEDGPVHTALRPQWRQGAEEPYVWVESELTSPVRPPPRPAQGKAKAPPAAPTAPTVPPVPPVPPAPPAGGPNIERHAFKGNAAAVQMLRSYAELKAQRDLGLLAKLDGKTYGLPAPEAYLEVAREGRPALRLELGRPTYGGSARYAHNPADGHVYLLRAAELRRFVAARGSLLDRDLLGFKLGEAARVELSAAAAHRTLHRLGNNQWAAAAEATEPDAEAAALLTMLERLNVIRYTAEETPPAGVPALGARVFRGDSAEPDAWLRLYPPEGAAARAVSSYTERPVELPRQVVQQVLEKARALLQGT
jgi:Domain of unknown function (DUF4340)